ncbi:NFATC2-interacting protein isoform X2 [Denticeps clupeoides]|uniref:NFATC2-interacting protein isoform X2 n=1 Tax=Denticeps clupeoides TaxID=299321 RepID=UPI0010A394DF|nr:NFATC2-interacting protein isoform X2 [Denticeps clupeoides]
MLIGVGKRSKRAVVDYVIIPRPERQHLHRMAEAIQISDSGSDTEAPTMKPPPKRRRILDPSAIPKVSIYSSKVDRSLELKPAFLKAAHLIDVDEEEAALLPQDFLEKQKTKVLDVDVEEEHKPQDDIRSPSPPPPLGRACVKLTRRANRKIREINKTLSVIDSIIKQSDKTESVPAKSFSPGDYDDYDDDDIVLVSSAQQQNKKPGPSPHLVSQQSRQISLKFRCRTELLKIPVQSMAPLTHAVDQLSVKLGVPPNRILLLMKEVELSVTSTASELGLTIADIIDCVVIPDERKGDGKHSDVITVRLQSKEKGSAQEYSLRKDEPLRSIFSQYVSSLDNRTRQRVSFLFDGSRVTHSQTPSDLDMEDGDVIEAWV